MKRSGIPGIGISRALLLALLCTAPAFAQHTTPGTHPAWEQLSTAERDLLTAPQWDGPAAACRPDPGANC